MSEHGFLQPNPVLFDLENRKKKSSLAHELGAGADCLKCGKGCSGFQLHFWRKVCLNCRCTRMEHAVSEEEDHGKHFVGKIFDRPLRTHAEESRFIYGEEDGNNQVCLDWAPPGVPSMLATKYLNSLPVGHLSIQGSEGAARRLAQLERQFPLHDVEPEQCHQLSKGEIEEMSSYVDNVKKNIVGQGTVEELAPQGDLEREETPSPPPPPPPMELLETDPVHYTMSVSVTEPCPPLLPSMGTYYAQPYTGNGLPLPPQPFHPQAQHKLSREEGRQQHQQVGQRQLGGGLHRGHGQGLAQGHKLGQGQGKGHSSTGSSPTSSPSPSPCSPPLGCPGAQVGSGQGSLPGWRCVGCHQEMLPGSVAVFAERAGRDRCWHPACFRCNTCGDRLEDLLYFYSKGQLYCGRDFAQLMNIPRCSACDELIFSSEYTGAEGGTWHLKHFCCWICDAPLAGHKYIAEGGQPHCLPCWQTHHGKVCSTCGQVIDPQGQRVSLGEQHWHASQACFRCGICDRSLLGGKMSKRGSTLLCSSACGQQLALRKQQESLAGPSLPQVSSSSSPPCASPRVASPPLALQPPLPSLGRPMSPPAPLQPSLPRATSPTQCNLSARASPVSGLVSGMSRLGVQGPKDGLPPLQRKGSRDSRDSVAAPRRGSRPDPVLRPSSACSDHSSSGLHSRQGEQDSKRGVHNSHSRQGSQDSGHGIHTSHVRQASADSGRGVQSHSRQGSGDSNRGLHSRQGSGDSGRGLHSRGFRI